MFGFTGGSGLGRGHIGLTRANVLDPAFDADKADGHASKKIGRRAKHKMVAPYKASENDGK